MQPVPETMEFPCAQADVSFETSSSSGTFGMLVRIDRSSRRKAAVIRGTNTFGASGSSDEVPTHSKAQDFD